MQDLISNISATQILHPVLSTSTRTSSTLDLQGYHSCLIIANVGLSLDAINGSNYWTIKVQHSDTGSSWADTTSADYRSGVASYVVNSTSLDETAYLFGYVGTKRYVRAVFTPTGSHSSGTPVGASAVRGEPALMPVV